MKPFLIIVLLVWSLPLFAQNLSLTMDRAVSMALDHSASIQSSMDRQELYRLAARQRFRDLFPSLSLSYMEYESVVVHDTDNKSRTLSANVDIVLYDAGARRRELAIARLEMEKGARQVRIAQNELVLQVITAFLSALQQRDTVNVYAQALEQGRVQKGFIEKELSLGEATRLEVMEIDAQVQEMALRHEEAMNARYQAVQNLKSILRLHWKAPLTLAGNLERELVLRPPSQDTSTDILVSQALRRREEIREADVSLRISQWNYEAARKRMLPKITLGLSGRLTGEEGIPREKGWGLTLTLSSPLYGNSVQSSTGYDEDRNGGSRSRNSSTSMNLLDDVAWRSQRIDALIALQDAEATGADIRRQVAIEVESALQSLRGAWRQIHLATRQRDLYDAQLEIERLRADLGEARRYDVVKKEIERSRAAVALVQARVAYISAVSSLEHALGMDTGAMKLWSMEKSEKTTQEQYYGSTESS